MTKQDHIDLYVNISITGFAQQVMFVGLFMFISLLVQFEHSLMRCVEVVTYHKRNGFSSTYQPVGW